MLIGLDGVQKSNCSIVEVGFGIELRVGQEVDEGSLLDRLVLSIDTVIFELLLGVSQVLVLFHLNSVGPLVGELSVLVVRESVVENSEFGTDEVGEMTDFEVSNEVSNQVLMMPDHTSQPIVVLPTAKSTDSVDRGNVKTKEKDTSS